MSVQNFTFPPPPPPPPKAVSTYPANCQPGSLPNNAFNARGNRPFRGRGRGDGHRGARGGGQGNFLNSSFGSPRGGGYFGLPNNGYPPQTNPEPTSPYSLPEYPQEQQPQYQISYGNPLQYPAVGIYSQSNGYEPVQPGLNRAYHSGLSSYTNGYTPQGYGLPQMHPHAPQNQPCMGPPIRMGFDNNSPQAFQAQAGQLRPYGQSNSDHKRTGPNPRFYDQNRQRNTSQQNNRKHPSTSYTHNTSQGPSRGNCTVSQRLPWSIANSQAAPAVPSFGIPLPLKPPAPTDVVKKPKKKKKRKHNQLGLTPKAEEHESSEEEDDVDEEAKLAAAVGAVGSYQQLQFTYRGQTATLQSSADIAAWIEERKKRYPTKARAQEVAERKRLLQEAQKASSEALKQKQEKRKSEQRERRKQVKADGNRKEQEKAKLDPQDAALKAKIKAEKLRRRLVKEERRVEKAEAKAEEARLKAEATQTGTCSSPLVTAGMKRKREDYDNAITAFSADNGHPNGDKDERVSLGDNKIIPQEEESPTEKDGRIISLDDMITKASTSSLKNIVSATPDPAATLKPPVTPREHPSTISDTGHREFLPQPNVEETDSSSVDTMSISSSSSEPSEDDDNTSSSGSSSDEDAPDEAPSKRDGPERVPPPKRERPKSICKAFLKTGRCKRGGRCRFLHELPERGSSRAAMVEGKKTSGQAKQEPRPKRKRLYELLVEQEKEKEDQQILQAIIYLGQSGVLDPPSTTTEPASGSVQNEE